MKNTTAARRDRAGMMVICVAGATLFASLVPAFGEDKPATTTTGTASAQTPAPAPASQDFFNGPFIDAFKNGKVNIDVRLRNEYADQEGLSYSDAFTLRTRLGFTTAPLYGFQGMLEGQNVVSLTPEHNYNAAGANGQPGKTVIADPPVTRVSQAWMSYSNWDSTVKGGVQHMTLDNQRFIGDAAWRQIWQTYGAASFTNQSIPDVSVFYSYIWHVYRVYGDVDGLPPANQDFDSHSDLINISYKGWKYGTFTAYSYLLDFPNSVVNSSASFGGSFAGGATLDPDTHTRLNYRVEYAHQTDYANQPISYNANYYNIELGGEYLLFNAGAGYEVMGSDHGKQGFMTPLATLHPFNGYAEVFLKTPAAGLRDIYTWAGVNLPGNIPLRLIYRKYDADYGGADFGQEIDAVISHKFGKHWTALLEYANYVAHDASPPAQAKAADVQRFWAQLEFNF